MLAIVCLLFSIAHAQQCASLTKTLPYLIQLPAGSSSVALNFEWGTLGLGLTGGAGLSADSYLIENKTHALNITSFGGGSGIGDGTAHNSAVGQPARSSTLIYTIALLFGALGVVGLKRAEPFLLVVLCLCVVPFASSACPAAINVRGTDAVLFFGDVKSRLTITCPQGGTPNVEVSDEYTYVECPFIARYSRVWASNSNAPGCDVLAPRNVSVEKPLGAGMEGVIHFGALELKRVDNYTLQAQLNDELAQGVPLQNPTTFSQVRVVAGGPLVDLVLQNIDVDRAKTVKALPVIIRQGANICKFGYMCQEGSCTYSPFSYSGANVCVEYGLEDPVPPYCSARGNGTGSNCGIACQSLTCTTMCPSNDCSMARACLTTDTNAYPCQSCQCPDAAFGCMLNSARSVSSSVLLSLIVMLLHGQ